MLHMLHIFFHILLLVEESDVHFVIRMCSETASLLQGSQGSNCHNLIEGDHPCIAHTADNH